MSLPSRPPRGSAFTAGMFGIPYPPRGLVDMESFRAHSCNQPSRFREALQTGKPLIGTGLAIASLPVARIVGTLGFDWVFIDAEHTPMGPDLMTDLIKTINYHSEGTMAAVVRLPTHGHEWIAWALDAGAAGIILPHTETADQVRHIVDAARFSPYGHRSFPPFAQLPGFTDGTPAGKNMLDIWTEHAAIIIQIESELGSKNAEEICDVPGVDGIMIGTGDLRLDMRLPFGFEGPEPEYQQAIKRIEDASKAKGLPLVGFALGQQMLEAKLAKGYTGLMVTADVLSLLGGQAQSLKMCREVVQDREESVNGKAVKKLDVNGVHTNGVTTNGVTNGQ